MVLIDRYPIYVAQQILQTEQEKTIGRRYDNGEKDGWFFYDNNNNNHGNDFDNNEYGNNDYNYDTDQLEGEDVVCWFIVAGDTPKGTRLICILAPQSR